MGVEKFSTWVIVVAAALIADDGTVLMQERPADKQHGGLWEFPGGKIDLGETPVAALVREIDEELGVTLRAQDLFPISAAAGDPAKGDPPLVLLLFGTRRWQGEPRALEAGCQLQWTSAHNLQALAMPPLDVPLAQALIPLLEGVAKARGAT